ncbi:hypothetical protein [Kribbella qitaiheensis]|nr:hypothetical protein [Kribbella qitaiheensis]
MCGSVTAVPAKSTTAPCSSRREQIATLSPGSGSTPISSKLTIEGASQ